MKSRKQISFFLAASVLFLTAGSAYSQDWPQWRGTNRDGKVNGFTVPKEWPKELKQAWKVPVGFGDATPALTGNKLYVFARQGDEEVLLCLDASNGNEIWRNKYKAQPVTGPAASHPGPRSTPAVGEGKVVTLGTSGVVTCVDANTGKEVWHKDEFPNAVPQFFTSMSPIIVDGMCIAHLGNAEKGVVVAYELTSGNSKWKWEGDGPSYSSPVLMTIDHIKQIVFLTDKNIAGIAIDKGNLLWKVAAPVQQRYWNSVTPVIDGETVIYTGQGDGTKAIKVEKQGDSFVTKEIWSNKDFGTVYNTPVLKDGLLYGNSNNGNFFCLDAKTGKMVWSDTNRSDNFCSIIDIGSVFLAIPTNKSELIAFKPNDKKYEETARIKVSDTPVYAYPIASGKRIYIKDKESVIAYSVE